MEDGFRVIVAVLPSELVRRILISLGLAGLEFTCVGALVVVLAVR